MLPTLKYNAAAGYQGSMKKELLNSAGLLELSCQRGSIPAPQKKKKKKCKSLYFCEATFAKEITI